MLNATLHVTSKAFFEILSINSICFDMSNDLFFDLNENICNFADDTTSFACDENLAKVMQKLEENSEFFYIEWFLVNHMKMNPSKCHLIVSGNRNESVCANIGQERIWEEQNVKLLGVTIDNRLKFENHISTLCLNAGRKLSALTRLFRYTPQNKRRVLIKSFFESQFRYCPLIWMFCIRNSNNKINALHKRALRKIYKDYNSSFENLLTNDNSFSIHHINIQRENKIHNSPKPSTELSKSQTKTQTSRSHSLT